MDEEENNMSDDTCKSPHHGPDVMGELDDGDMYDDAVSSCPGGLVVRFENVSCKVRPERHGFARLKSLKGDNDPELKTILYPMSGVMYPGEVVGILGPSGAGKTTLLDILAGKKSVGLNKGEITATEVEINEFLKYSHSAHVDLEINEKQHIEHYGSSDKYADHMANGNGHVDKMEENGNGNGYHMKEEADGKMDNETLKELEKELEEKRENLSKSLGYVPQDDAYIPSITVMEMMQFHAKLRAPRVPEEERTKRIKRILRDIGLDKAANTVIGGVNFSGISIRGLSGGEKRRLSLGCCLLGCPRILFLDEFTTGLDSYNALHMMSLLKTEATTRNVTIAATIHQPQLKIWNMLDKVFILSGGRMMFAGHPHEAMPWFRSIGYGDSECDDLKAGFNPAEFVLEVVTLSGWKEEQDDDEISSMLMHTDEDLEEAQLKFFKSCAIDFVPSGEAKKYRRVKARVPGKFLDQFPTLLHRSILKYKRDFFNLAGRILTIAFIAVLVGLVFGGKDETGPIQITTEYYFSIVTLLIVPFVVVQLFLSERQFYIRESGARLYGSFAYYVANTIPEMFILFTSAIIYTCITYFWLEFRPDASAFFKAMVVFCLVHWNGALYIVLASLLLPNSTLAMSLGGGAAVLNLLFAGQMVAIEDIPDAVSWISYLCTARYAQSALIQNEFNTDEVYEGVTLPGINTTSAVFGACSDVYEAYFGTAVPAGLSVPDDLVDNIGLEIRAKEYLESGRYPWSYSANVGALLIISFVLNLLSYLSLRFFTKDQR